MKVAVFSSKPYDIEHLLAANRAQGHELTFLEPRLMLETASLAAGHRAVCVFVNDRLDASVLGRLAGLGVGLVALRCAGFNNVDLAAAAELGIAVARVPAYSPHSVAEHTLALMLTLLRKIHRAVARVREGNFALDGLLGGELHDSAVGVVGTGHIGQVVVRILAGFGARILAHDIAPHPACVAAGARYVALGELMEQSDIITLHCPLLPATRHLVNRDALARMRTGAMLINTSRGGLVDTRALIEALKTGKLGSVGIDVYEEEADLFFEDLSGQVLQDDVFARLLTFPNVVVTGHQAFFTEHALRTICETTLGNISSHQRGEACPNTVGLDKVRRA